MAVELWGGQSFLPVGIMEGCVEKVAFEICLIWWIRWNAEVGRILPKEGKNITSQNWGQDASQGSKWWLSVAGPRDQPKLQIICCLQIWDCEEQIGHKEGHLEVLPLKSPRWSWILEHFLPPGIRSLIRSHLRGSTALAQGSEVTIMRVLMC